MAPNAATGCTWIAQIDVLDVQQAGGKAAIHARSRFRTLDSGVWVKKQATKSPLASSEVDPRATNRIHISPDGRVEK